jgi:uncharacterized iron-regulated membrane protein
MRRFLILLHRYLGIPLSFVFVLWFVSGIAMLYAGGMPQLTPQARLERLPVLDLARVKLAAPAAAAAAGVVPERTVLSTVLERPAYRFSSPFGAATVFADSGEVLETIDVDAARTVASHYLELPEEAVRFVRTVAEPDQWTLVLARDLPLHKFSVADGRGTEVYVSPALAEVRLVTTRASRSLAWVGTIPHWLYFTPLRANQPLWYWTVVVLSGLGCVLAAAGLVLAVTQFRKSRPFRLSASIRYTGWMRWHYVFGALFGVFALTWVFSGLLSMEPFRWTNPAGLEVDRDAFGGAANLEHFAPLDAARWKQLLAEKAVKEIELTRIQDEPYYVARYTLEQAGGRRERLHEPYRVAGGAQPERLLISAADLTVRTEPFSVESLLARLRTAAPGAAIVEAQLLGEYDSYYYSRGNQAPLPVLRAKLDDPLETWVYVDPRMSQVVAVIHRFDRLERWLYNGLHSLDFSFWYGRRPLWDIGMIALSLGALAASLIGLYVGVKRVRRDLARLAEWLRPARD